MLLFKWLLELCALCALQGVARAEPFDIDAAVSSDGVVHGNDRLIDRIFREPRPYDVALILTAESPRYQCGFCGVLGPDIREAARLYHSQNENRTLYFVLADLDYSQQTFQALGLSTAPHLYWYPATLDPAVYKKRLQAPHDPIMFNGGGSQLETCVGIINRKGFPVKIVRPVRWDKIGNAIATLFFVLAGAYLFWPRVVAVYQSKKLWLAITLVLTLVFISGHMFTVTRGTPFMGLQDGKPQYVQPGYGSQYGVETQILSLIYALLAFCSILLITRVPLLEGTQQTVAGSVLLVGVLLVFSLLISIFKIKNPGFPFTLVDIKL